MAQILFNWLTPLRWIFLAIDSLLFGLIDGCYTIIISFANAELFTTEQIAELRTKIYFVITLIAFFRLAFLLVNSLINPDKLTDENEGLSKIAFNFVIMLVLLVVTPIIFNIALEFQKEVVNGNVITGIFSLSNSSGYSCNDTYTDKQLEIDRNDYKTEEDYLKEKEHKKAAKCSSDKMKGLVISSLIYPDSKIAHEEDGKYAINDDVTCTGSCKDAIEAYNTMTEDGYYDFLTLEKYIAATGEVNDSEVFAYNYTLIITTICAGFIVYILLSFAFDLGKRLLELNLLMILSPLFIATYVDPKSAKSGPFNNWLKAIGKSYVSLFLKLAALAVMLLFIKILSINKVGLKPIGPIGFIILLFAGLTFCKELPKWLGGLLGSEGGMGELGLGKKLENTPFVGKGLMGAARKAGHMASGMAAGAVVGAAAGGYNTLKDRTKRRGEAGLGYFRKNDNIGKYANKEALRNARKKAYARDGNAANGGFFKQMKAGMLGAGLAGGRAGVKADNIKGAFQGSVKAADSFGKSVGNRSGTVKAWVSDKLDAKNDKIALAYGSPSDLSAAREEIENNKKASTVAIGGKAGKYKIGKGKDWLDAGEVAVAKKAQEQIQKHAASKAFELDSDGKKVAISYENLEENQRFAMTKTYQAASFAFGEKNVSGVILDGNNIQVSLNGSSTPLTVSLDDASKGKFGAEFKGAASFGETTEGAKAFTTTYYESQQATLQTSEKYAESDRRLSESLSTLSSTINALKTNFDSKLPEGVSSFKNVFDEAIASLSEEDRKSSAKVIAALEDKGKAVWPPELLEDAKYIARQEERESSLKAEHEIVLEKLSESREYIKTWIDGKDPNEKAIKVEKAIAEAKGYGFSTPDEDK